MGLTLALRVYPPDKRDMMWRAFFWVFWICVATTARADVVVFAAASLKEPLDALAAETDNVIISYGGSGALARQITLGAPADVVILANDTWIDVLAEGGHLVRDSMTDVARNELVLIGASGAVDIPLAVDSIIDYLGDGRLAIGLTGAVPAGIYAKAALQSLGLWGAVLPQLAEVDNVRAALALVARGQSPLGVVYATDALITDQVRVVARFPADSHPEIRYVGAVVTPSAEAVRFLDLLTQPQGQQQFAKAGFLPAEGGAND